MTYFFSYIKHFNQIHQTILFQIKVLILIFYFPQKQKELVKKKKHKELVSYISILFSKGKLQTAEILKNIYKIIVNPLPSSPTILKIHVLDYFFNETLFMTIVQNSSSKKMFFLI